MKFYKKIILFSLVLVSLHTYSMETGTSKAITLSPSIKNLRLFVASKIMERFSPPDALIQNQQAYTEHLNKLDSVEDTSTLVTLKELLILSVNQKDDTTFCDFVLKNNISKHKILDSHNNNLEDYAKHFKLQKTLITLQARNLEKIKIDKLIN